MTARSRLIFGRANAPTPGPVRLIFGDAGAAPEPAQVQVRVRVGGAWLPANIKRCTGSVWVTAAAHVRASGAWAPA